MKKKIMIFSASILLLVALVVGVSFAAWNNSSDDKNFKVTIGNNVNLLVDFQGYNDPDVSGGYDNMILVPDGAEAVNPLNTNNLLFGTFDVTSNGGWDDSVLGVHFDIKSFKLGDTIIAGSVYDVFDVKVFASSDVTPVADATHKSQPNANATALVAGAQLSLNTTYYVFISFKPEFNTETGIAGLDCDRNSYIGKTLKLNIELKAVVK